MLKSVSSTSGLPVPIGSVYREPPPRSNIPDGATPITLSMLHFIGVKVSPFNTGDCGAATAMLSWAVTAYEGWPESSVVVKSTSASSQPLSNAALLQLYWLVYRMKR